MNPNNFKTLTDYFSIERRTIFNAAEDGNLTELKYLMEEKKIDTIMANKCKCLWDAVGNGHLNVVTYLIEEQGVGINNQTFSAFDYIVLSIKKGHLNILEYLIKQNTKTIIRYNDLLILAIENNRLNIVNYLLGLDIDIIVVVMNYALFLSMKYYHIDIVKCLLEHGADIHVENDYILRSSAENGRLDDVKYFIEHGADINTIKYLASSTKEIHSYIVDYLHPCTFKMSTKKL
jgi:Ankyrin repeats (3 copies)